MGFGDTIINVAGNGWNYVNKSLDNAANTAVNVANNPSHAVGTVGQGVAQQVRLGGQLLANQWHTILGGH